MTAFTATVTGSLSDNPRFHAWLAARMERSVVAGANAVAEAHAKVIVGWSRKPGFGQKDLSDMSRLLALREVRVTGPHAWKWLLTNYGGSTLKDQTKPITKYMKFPWPGKGLKSYSAATDTGTKGAKIGTPSVTFLVKERSVKARNMIGTVSRLERRNIFDAMRRAF